MSTDSELKAKTSKGLFWGGTSSLIRQLLSAGFGIYLARTLAPSDYGLIGMLAIFGYLATVFTDSGLGAALINSKEEKHEEYNAVFWFNVIVSTIFTVSVFFGAHAIADYFHHEELVGISRCYALGFIISGLGMVHSTYLSKHLKVKEISIINILATFVSGLLGVFLAWRGFAYWALMLQALLQSIISNVGLWVCSPWRPTFHIDFRPVWKMMRFTIKLIITSIFSVVSGNYITVLLGRYYRADQVGQYTNANKWCGMGTNTLSGMVNSVAHPVLASVVEDGTRQLRVFRKLIRFASFMCFPAMLGLAFVAPEFIALALTDKWAESVPLLQILCIGGAFSPMGGIFTSLIISRGRSDRFMWSNIGLGTLVLATIFVFNQYGITAMVIGVTSVNILWLLVWYWLVHKEIGYSFFGFMSDTLPFLGITIMSIALAWLATKGVENLVLLLFLKIVVTAAIYTILMRFTNSVTFKETIQFFKGRLSTHE